MAKNEDWLQRVRYTAAEPTSWLSTARTLRQAAEDLWNAGNAHDANPGSELGATLLGGFRDPEFVRPLMGGSTFDVCVLLCGFAVENLVKGIIVCRDPTVVRADKLDGWHGSGHNLVPLFDRAGIVVSEAERDVLVRASRATLWKGRYPVPKHFDHMTGEDRVIGLLAISNVWPEDVYRELSALYDRSKGLLIKAMEETPPIPADHKFANKRSAK